MNWAPRIQRPLQPCHFILFLSCSYVSPISHFRFCFLHQFSITISSFTFVPLKIITNGSFKINCKYIFTTSEFKIAIITLIRELYPFKISFKNVNKIKTFPSKFHSIHIQFLPYPNHHRCQNVSTTTN